MKTKWVLIIISILCFLLVISCGKGAQLQALKDNIAELTEEVDTAFEQSRLATIENVKIMEDLYNNRDKYNLSLDNFDEQFKIFNNFVIYKIKDEGNGLIYSYLTEEFYNNKSILEEGKNLCMLTLNVLDKLKANTDKLKYKTSHYFFADDLRVGATIAYPYYDVTSTLAPGFPAGVLRMYYEWYKAIVPENNPEKKGVWTQDVFVNPDGSGYIWTYSHPVYSKGNKFEGACTKDIFVLDLKNLIDTNDKDIIMFLSSSLSLLGLSQKGKEILELNELTDFDYVSMMRTAEFVADSFKLSFEENSQGIKNIAQQINAGETEFEQDIDGIKYMVIVSKISEVPFYIVGLLPM